MMARRARTPAKPKGPSDDDVAFALHELRLRDIREVTTAETFRVFADASDPHRVGEYVVRIDKEGIAIRPSHEDAPDYESESEHAVDWHLLQEIAGGADEIRKGIQRDTQSIIDELEAWEAIRDHEAHRILRAKFIQRTATMRRLCELARDVFSVWERPRVPTPSGTWRELVKRRNGRPSR